MQPIQLNAPQDRRIVYDRFRGMLIDRKMKITPDGLKAALEIIRWYNTADFDQVFDILLSKNPSWLVKKW